MNTHKFEINSLPGAGSYPTSYLEIAKGIKNVSPENNEEVAQDKYLDGAGFGETDVIGAQLVLSFTGDRDYADPAQNFIMGLSLDIGTARRTEFRWTEPDGGYFDGSCTIANISGPSGDAGAKGEISFEIHFNGLPVYVGPNADVTAPTVTVVPADAATAVAVTADIVWTFSEAIQSAFVTDANFFVTKGSDGTLVAGALSINAAKTVVTFNPTASLTATTAYIAVATKNVKDVAGNSLATNSVTNFTTV